ncbi:MAG TPA: PadR family transcriptional regulator [Chitinophagaceae bacterium]|jgi:PadR family transcriptional regulator PadR|nr:PadR family transcriptional regulator [Chitinophagaceae bacterium]
MKDEFLKNWDTQMKKGLLPLFVLHIIAEKTCYGYELIERLKEITGFDITESTMYPLLTRLLKEGLLEAKWVEQNTGIPRKYYSLTKDGKSKLSEMKEASRTIFSKII